MNKEIMRRETIEEICINRNKTIDLYIKAAEALDAARASHARLTKQRHRDVELSSLRDGVCRERFIKSVENNIDANVWEDLLDVTKLRSLMDSKAMQQFRDGLSDPAPVTPDTVHATLQALRGDSWMIFKRGLLSVFERLCRDYKSHDGFKIGKRIVLEHGVQVEKYYSSLRAVDTLLDVDRIFHVLDGKPAPEYQYGLCAAIRLGLSSSPMQTDIQTPYFRVKLYKKGTIHLFPLRDDLVQKVNLIIADHFGATLGAAPDVADRRRGPVVAEPAPDDFYETSYELADQMIDAIGVTSGQTILEPSAGIGGIARRIVAVGDVSLVCIEYAQTRADELRRILPYAKVIQGDFLDKMPSQAFDRVIMNPPFSRGLDVMHVRHALDFLRPGGRIAAIMAGNALNRQNKEVTDLRRYLDLGFDWRVERLPERSFRSAGTMVSTVLLIAEKRVASKQIARI